MKNIRRINIADNLFQISEHDALVNVIVLRGVVDPAKAANVRHRRIHRICNRICGTNVVRLATTPIA